MTELGTIVAGSEIGRRRRCSYIKAVCSGCGSERWVELVRGKPRDETCNRCSTLRPRLRCANPHCRSLWHGYGNPAVCPRCKMFVYAIVALAGRSRRR